MGDRKAKDAALLARFEANALAKRIAAVEIPTFGRYTMRSIIGVSGCLALADALGARDVALRSALKPLASLPTDFARHDDQPVFTVLGGPFGETPQAQSWAGNRSIYVRDIRAAREVLNG